MNTYTITNDRYSNQPDVATFQELVTMCQENGWPAGLRVRGSQVVDERGEVVAEAAPETVTNYNADQLEDFVNEWVANNPDRLAYAYDNAAAFIGWKREAARRIADRDTLTQSGLNAVEAWADEAEAAN